MYIGVSESMLYKLTSSKEIPHYKPRGKMVYFAKEELDEWLVRVVEGEPLYVLLDEVQTIKDWEDVVRRLYKRPRTQVVLTGSNAHLLSSDLATHISGRYIELDVMPLQFDEYRTFCDACGWSFASDAAMFEAFLAYGGMPGLFQFDQDDLFGKEKMLSGIFDTVVMNDVALRTSVSDFDLLSKLIRYVFSTSGNLFSTKKVADALSAAGKKTASETVESYLTALRDALVLSECEQFGLAGKDILRPQRKFYPIDNGLRNLTSGFQSAADAGFKLECLVYNQLRARGYDVKVGLLLKGEVDFVAVRGTERSYYQVALSVVDDGVLEREKASLEAIDDSFPKTILTLDGLRSGCTETGIRIESVLKWCEQ